MSENPSARSARGVIQVTRVRLSSRDRFRSYPFFIDGRRVGSLRRGETERYQVIPGPHVVMIKVDWAGSAPLDVSVQPGETVRLECRPTRGTSIRELLRRHRWISLENVEDQGQGR
jgi:hypothetical protein